MFSRTSVQSPAILRQDDGASKIGLKSILSNAITRTMAEKASDIVFVEDFDTVQNALNSGAKVINCREDSVFNLSAPLTVPAGVFINANRATFNSTSRQKLFNFTSGGGIAGAVINGLGDAALIAGDSAIACEGTNNSPAAPTYVSAPIVIDCIISGLGEYGVWLNYTNGGLIRNNTIENVAYAGVGGASCEDLTITENTIYDIDVGSGGGDAYGIFVDRLNGTSETENPRSYRVNISKNTIKNISAASGNNGQGIDTHAGVDFVIADNIINGCEVGIAATSSVISGVVSLGCRRVKISNNTIRTNNNVGYGVLVSGALSGGVVNDYSEDVTVVGNTIDGHGAPNDTLSGAIFAQGTKNLVISGNSIKEPNSCCVCFGLSNIGFNLAGNTLRDPFDNNLTVPSCIAVNGDDNRGFIGANTFVRDNSAKGTYVAVNSIRIFSGLSGLNIDFGKCTFEGISATDLKYVEQTSSGVNSEGLFSERGQDSVSLVSGNASDILSIAFSKRAPAIPKDIQISIRGGVGVGGKTPVFRINNVSTTGFDVIVYPYDLSTWSLSGSLDISWGVRL